MYQKINCPLFMIGMPRSGTSALAEAISLHEELGWFSNYLNRFPSSEWLAIMDRITNIPLLGWYLRGKKKQDRSLSSLVRKCLPYCAEANFVWGRHCGEKFLWDYLIAQEASEIEKKDIVACIGKVLRYQKKKRFFAKFTGPPRINYLNSIFPKAFYVHVIRDPRAVVSSLLKARFWKNGGGLEAPWWKNGLSGEDIDEWEKSEQSPIALNAIQWRKVVELTWREKEVIAEDQYLEIRYENFVDAPHEMLSMVFRILDLKDSHAAHRYISSIGELINMNYKYKSRLNADEIAMVEKITYQTANRAGYEYNR